MRKYPRKKDVEEEISEEERCGKKDVLFSGARKISTPSSTQIWFPASS
jgi:hypothetical protein